MDRDGKARKNFIIQRQRLSLLFLSLVLSLPLSLSLPLPLSLSLSLALSPSVCLYSKHADLKGLFSSAVVRVIQASMS